MAKLKTKPTAVSVKAFINKVADPKMRADAFAVLEMMKEVTGLEPKMWGPSIIGFGTYHYKYDSGHEGDMCRVGFSPRKAAMSLYVMPCTGLFTDQLKKLGKHKTGVACLYVKRLSDIDMNVLREMTKRGFEMTENPQKMIEEAKAAAKKSKRKC